jgi:hypothetical protein
MNPSINPMKHLSSARIHVSRVKKSRISEVAAILMAGMGLMNCAGPGTVRVGYDETQLTHEENCELVIAKHKDYSDSAKPLGSYRVFDRGTSTQCKEWRVNELIRSEGCALGAKVAHLKNIQEPSFFGSSCFQTEVDFYDEDPAKFSKDKPQFLTFDTVSNLGLRLGLSGGVGGITGGDQTRTGVIWIRQDNGDTVESIENQVGFGVFAGYGFTEWLTADLGYRVRFASSSPKGGNGKDDLKLFTKHYLTAAPQFDVFGKDLPMGRFNLVLGGEVRYVWFKLDPDFKDFLLNQGGIIPNEGTASGFGWAGTWGMEWLRANGFMTKMNFGVGHESPGFSGLPALDAWDFGVELELGYKFNK